MVLPRERRRKPALSSSSSGETRPATLAPGMKVGDGQRALLDHLSSILYTADGTGGRGGGEIGIGRADLDGGGREAEEGRLCRFSGGRPSPEIEF